MKYSASNILFGLAVIVACAPPPTAKVVAPIPVQHQYIPPEVGLNNSGLDTSLVTKIK